MNLFSFVYNTFLFEPLFNLLVGVTNVLPGHYIGVSIIFVTLFVRIILLPSSLHQARQMQNNQNKMGDLQHKLKDIQKMYQDDKAKQAEATMALYRESGVNPASGCLPLLIQLPILIALYRVFLVGIGPETYHFLYGFVAHPESVQTVFFGASLIEPNIVLGVIAGFFQFLLMKFFSGTSSAAPGSNEETAQMMASMQKNMAYMFPVMTVFIALQVPSALALYWIASTIFGIIQQYYFKRVLHLSSNTPTI